MSTGTGNARVYPAPVLALSLDPKSLLDSLHPYGEIGLILIIFAETGLLFGLILPGDSLLFTGGLLASQGHLNIAAVAIFVFVICLGLAGTSTVGTDSEYGLPVREAFHSGKKSADRKIAATPAYGVSRGICGP